MKKNSLAIATISWARNKSEEQLLAPSLKALSALGYPVFVTDGGSSKAFLDLLRGLPHVQVSTAKGLWPQAKTSLAAAASTGAATILYTEPDKEVFFSRHLQAMLNTGTLNDHEGVLLASRSATGFATFPPFQQITESTINNCCREIIGKDLDYCYGPFLFSSRLVPALEALPANCGWGWRPFLFVMAHRLGMAVNAYEGNFHCPPDQQSDNAGERIYRMKQLTQNIEGIILATAQNLPRD